ncbi:MAG: hypothetical protein NZL93_04900, partial [Chthoniobacterales bacterium]|nr:hypothetical protein [Chthoniobacterales bacterium]
SVHEHVNGAIVAEECAAGEADVVGDTDVGGIGDSDVALNGAVFANRVETAMAAEVFCSFFSTWGTKFAVEGGEDVVAVGEPAKEVKECARHGWSESWM